MLVIDEADNLVKADAEAGYPLLSALRSLQSRGKCSVLLAGYWHLFRATLDHRSPLYNFATVRRLGPLDPEAGRALADEPMRRLGLDWADAELPARIVRRTGGYPDLIQAVCDQVLVELRQHHTLTLTAAQLDAAESSDRVRERLVWSFQNNIDTAGQLLVDGLIERDAFTLTEAHQALEQAVRRRVPLAVLDRLLVQLVLYGFIREADGRYGWTIPLLRETLTDATDRDHRRERLLTELAADPELWVGSLGSG